MKVIENFTTFDTKKVRPSNLPIQTYIHPSNPTSKYLSLFNLSFHDFSFNSSIFSLNQNTRDATTMPTHLLTSPIPYTQRLFNPLQHQL